MGSNPIGGTVPNCSLRSLRIALWSPPTSSSLGTKSVSPPSSAHCSLRSRRLALLSRCLPHSLADEQQVCSLPRPGQRRASLAQLGGARSGVELLAPLARIALCLIARSARADRSGSGARTGSRRQTRLFSRSGALASRPQTDNADREAHSTFKARKKGSMPSVSVH